MRVNLCGIFTCIYMFVFTGSFNSFPVGLSCEFPCKISPIFEGLFWDKIPCSGSSYHSD